MSEPKSRSCLDCAHLVRHSALLAECRMRYFKREAIEEPLIFDLAVICRDYEYVFKLWRAREVRDE